MIGTIARWGSKGFGFISAPDLPDAQIWTHAKYLVDPNYVPRSGDRVEFEPEQLPDGRRQGRQVRAVGSPGPRPGRDPQPPLGTLGERLRPVLNGALASDAGATAPDKLAAQLAVQRRAREAENARNNSRREALKQESAQLAARLQAIHDEDARLGDEIHARTSRAIDEDQQRVRAHLEKAAQAFESSLAARLELQAALMRMRNAAMQRAGAASVAEYETVRRRLDAAADERDGLGREAFALLEKDRRSALREYATTLDRLDSAPPLRLRVFAFRESDPGRTTLVISLPATIVSSAADPRTRIACSLWHAAERAARELAEGAIPEHGAIFGLLAVRFGTCDPELLELLLAETISGRPTLEALGIEIDFEVVDEVNVPWAPAPAEDDSEAVAAGGEPSTYALPDVALRHGLSLRDLVAMLHDRGLAFPDDVIDRGTEQTLRVLLGDLPEEPDSDGPARDAPLYTTPPFEQLEGTIGIASRMLLKLLRDRRVGGRHTRMDNAWGHHFADGEKQAARRVAEWLEKEGIFLPKNNEGSHHISINPRRLRDVRGIIEGTWDRTGELERIS